VLRRPLLPVLLALVAGGLACRGGPAGPPPERFLPADAALVLVIPETGRAARELGALHATLSGFPGASDLAGARSALASQLGFDPLDPDALAEAGLDPRRGAALARLERPGGDVLRPTTLLVLPARDRSRLETLFARLARERLGASEKVAELHGGIPVAVFRRAPGEPPALSYAVTGRTALLAPGPGGPAAVAEAVTRGDAQSLATSPPWSTARSALGDRPAAIAFAPRGSRFLAGLWAVQDGIAVGISAGEDRLRARVAVLLGAREPSFLALAAKGGGAGAVARLDPTAPLAARWDGDFGALGRKLLPVLPAGERARLAARGIDPVADLFDLLAPGGALAVSLSPALDLTDLSEEDLRRDPLRLIRFEATAEAKDAARVRAVSERLVPPPRRGARAARAPDDGTFRIVTPSGEIAWRLDGVRLAVAGGPPGALDALVARLAGEGEGFRAPGETAAAALEGGLGGAVLDGRRLVASVRALPDRAFGTGPSGFVVRSVADRILEPAARIAAVSTELDLAPGALVVDVEVEARGPRRAAGARP
jgi:hypothetical protein